MNFWLNQLGFLIQYPRYRCVFAAGTPAEEKEGLCTEEYICAEDSRISSWKVDENNPNTLHNWHQKLDLMCEPGWKVGFIGSAFFVGWCCMYWMPRMADSFGRKNFFVATCIANTVLYTILMFCGNLYLMLLTLFAFGLVSSSRAVVGWMYMMELIPIAEQDFMGTIFQGLNSSIYLVATLYFWWVNNDWFYFTAVGYLLQVISLLLICIIPESPLVLIEQNRMTAARGSLERIAWCSGKELDSGATKVLDEIKKD